MELRTSFFVYIIHGSGDSMLMCSCCFRLSRKNHYQRPLEEAISAHSAQWPKAWNSNPLHGGRTFASMSAEERVR